MNDQKLRDAITQLRRQRDAHQMDEPEYVDAVVELIKSREERLDTESRLDEIGKFQDRLQHTVTNEQGAYIASRYSDLTKSQEING